MNDDLKKICIPEHDKSTEVFQKIDQAGYRYEFEERAAILEYDAGLSRDQAERISAKEIIERYNLKGI